MTTAADVLAAVERLDGRMDRMAGAFDKLLERLDAIAAGLPEQERFCPPWADDETGEVRCLGSVRLMRSAMTIKKGEGKEWTHPLPENAHHVAELPSGGSVIVKWHNVYNSKAHKTPIGGEERPWPGNGGGHAAPESPEAQAVDRGGQDSQAVAPDAAVAEAAGGEPAEGLGTVGESSIALGYWTSNVTPLARDVVKAHFEGDWNEMGVALREDENIATLFKPNAAGRYMLSPLNGTQEQAEAFVARLNEIYPAEPF